MIYASKSNSLAKKIKKAKDAEEKAVKSTEWFKGVADTIKRERDVAQLAKDKVEATLLQKEQSWKEAKKILSDLCVKYEKQIRAHDKVMAGERLKVTEVRNELDEG